MTILAQGHPNLIKGWQESKLKPALKTSVSFSACSSQRWGPAVGGGSRGSSLGVWGPAARTSLMPPYTGEGAPSAAWQRPPRTVVAEPRCHWW